jgi:hypothetical protein
VSASPKEGSGAKVAGRLSIDDLREEDESLSSSSSLDSMEAKRD